MHIISINLGYLKKKKLNIHPVYKYLNILNVG